MNDADFARCVKGSEPGASLPDAETIWWRAQLRRQLAEEERITRPVRIAERFAFSACVITAAVVAAVLVR
jgi:hypothetical protein